MRRQIKNELPSSTPTPDTTPRKLNDLLLSPSTMHLTITNLLLSLFSFPLLHALATSSPQFLTQTNITLPPLLPPAPNNLTLPNGLSVPGPLCFDPAAKALGPVSLESCVHTIPKIAAGLPPDIYLLPRVFKTAAAVDVKGGTKVPLTWKSGPGGCMVQVDSLAGMAGLADAAQFSLIGVAYFASLLVAECIQNEKEGVGGRFTIQDQGFFVDVRAAPVGDDVGDDGGDGTVATA
ncbi:MAG: hypothetical protein OHK93_007930 [Ramalina farinacea]|uniref:Uncharacterized protein n=1 Tax=Ramalina farinacea TaxID=258253 RepID=A0AA43TW22_9LECA|nr:hypothetical protein [Ramalina farinacea]